MFRHLMTLGPAFHERSHSGELMSRLTADTTQIKAAAGTALSQAARNTIMLIGALGDDVRDEPAAVGAGAGRDPADRAAAGRLRARRAAAVAPRPGYARRCVVARRRDAGEHSHRAVVRRREGARREVRRRGRDVVRRGELAAEGAGRVDGGGDPAGRQQRRRRAVVRRGAGRRGRDDRRPARPVRALRAVCRRRAGGTFGSLGRGHAGGRRGGAADRAARDAARDRVAGASGAAAAAGPRPRRSRAHSASSIRRGRRARR